MAELPARVDRLESAAAIRRLVSAYAVALDARDLDTLLGLFAPDVRASLVAPLRRIRTTILHAGTHVIDFDTPDTAHGNVYTRAELEIGPDRWVAQAIHYGDRYVRRDGRWLFAGRRHELFYGADHGIRPNGLPPADWPRDDAGAGTVPYRWKTWQDFWEAA
ncbi:nuclear transport factor 2 family protein [Dactylosporangium sp. CA-092794]|uniref:nuclear transport factor 2 family protein n=1 Tax=Dactylosporangium sp. CA-092794 TaxID=3239929 RepID=UPI003D929C10